MELELVLSKKVETKYRATMIWCSHCETWVKMDEMRLDPVALVMRCPRCPGHNLVFLEGMK